MPNCPSRALDGAWRVELPLNSVYRPALSRLSTRVFAR